MMKKSQKEKDDIYKKMIKTTKKRNQNEKDISNKKRSESLKKTRKNESIQKKEKRNKNRSKNWNKKNQYEINKKISLTKQKHPENVIIPNINLTIKRYKKMSDEEFLKWCEGRTQRVITRIINYRRRK